MGVAIVFLFLGLAAFGIGVYMFLDPTMLEQLEPTVRLVFSILLILYGLFRIITAIGGIRRAAAAKQA
jgi:hypothetical protein